MSFAFPDFSWTDDSIRSIELQVNGAGSNLDYEETDLGYETPCWRWLGTRTDDGYGRVWAEGRLSMAHVYLWERENGKKAPGMELDHLCRNRICCRPDHLELVSKTENIRRGLATTSTFSDALMCRLLVDLGYRQVDIAQWTGWTVSKLSKLARGMRWKDCTLMRAAEEILAKELRPTGDAYIVSPVPRPTRSRGGLELPDEVTSRPMNLGIIVEAGPGARFAKGDVIAYGEVTPNRLDDGNVIIHADMVYAKVGTSAV